MKYFIIIFIIIFCLALGIFSILFLNTKSKDSFYREISYQFIADKIVGKEKDKEKIALLLFDYIQKNLNVVGSQVIDKTSWNDLLRGIAWCDQQSWAFATLLSKEDISGRIVMLRDKHGVSPHTVAEVFLEGKWRVFDPLNNLIFRNSNNGSLATLEEISQNSSLISSNPKVLCLPVEQRNAFISWYDRMFPLPMEPKRWSPLLVKKNVNIYKRVVNKLIQYYVRFGGKNLVYLYQDLYLLLSHRLLNEPVEYLYFKARNYHLYERIALAEEFYQQVIKNYPQSERAEDSQFFLGVLNADIKKDNKAAIEEFNRLFKKYPKTKWAKVAHYFLGKSYELTGNLENAKVYYSKANFNLDTDSACSLVRLLRE